MSKISDIEDRINKRISQKDNQFDMDLEETYDRLTRSMKNTVEEKLNIIEKTTNGYILKIAKTSLKIWMIYILSAILILSMMSGFGYLQGKKIASQQQQIENQGRKIVSQQQQIKNQEKVLQNLDSWGISTLEGEGERFLTLPRGIIPETGYYLDGKECVKLKEVE